MKMNGIDKDTTVEDLPLEIISHIHASLPLYDMSSYRSVDNKITLKYVVPNYALCCKEWYDEWKKNRDSDFFEKLQDHGTINARLCKDLKVSMLSHLGFTDTIKTLLKDKMFDVLDLFVTSKYLDKSHKAWTIGRMECYRLDVTESIAYLDKYSL